MTLQHFLRKKKKNETFKTYQDHVKETQWNFINEVLTEKKYLEKMRIKYKNSNELTHIEI